ncbi:hypothetical protein E0W80_04415 [Microbacterium sp. PI-1]|uniref:hypothetical protein n=1 Tax=Microbacterium sp. PI-1 TaxID=2545631 RepID=UPI0010391E17|nr:hypothetical protein [Microbacterium sp. PI-1]TCJ28749.1 hypothetical protein E0W80_04415 [Microbacterium sp. PI-1]
MDFEWMKWGVPALISTGGAVLSIISLVRAGRADRRSERTERLDRVQFELRNARNQPGLYRLFNVGTDAVTGVEVEATAALGVAYIGQRTATKLNPTECITFTLSFTDVNVPVSLRVTWSGPFAGERWVLLPEDPAAPWAGVIWSPPSSAG